MVVVEVVEEEAEQDKEVAASKVVAIKEAATKVANKVARPADLAVEAVPVVVQVLEVAADVAEPAHPARMSREIIWIRKSSIRVSRFH